jgi:hypothetical protein
MVGMSVTAMLVMFGKASGMMRFDTEEDGEADAVDYVFWILAWPRILAMIIAAIYRRF